MKAHAKSRERFFATIGGLLIIVAGALAACGGSTPAGTPAAAATGTIQPSSPGNTPVGTVNAVLQALKDGKTDTLGQYACATQKNAFDAPMSVLGFNQSLLLTALVGPGASLKWIKLNLDSADVKQTNLSGDTATIHLTGQLTISYEVLNGGVTRDYSSSSGNIDQNVTLKNEGGSWLVCS